MATTQLLRSVLSSALAPLLIFAVLWAIVWLLKLRRIHTPWAALAFAMTSIVATFAVAYLFLPILFEDAETDIACVSALAVRGLPVYPALDAAQRYILLYGPFTYLSHIPFYLLFGENLFAFKLLGVTCLLVSLLGLYLLCRNYATGRASLIGLGCASLVLFRYIGVGFWGRIDPLILAMTVVSIWAILRGPLWSVVLVNALTAAVIPNLKISGFAYLLPVFALLAVRKSWRVALAAALLGAVLLPLPFLLPTVSLTNYVSILKVDSGHGLVLNFLIRNVQYSLLLLLPVLVGLYKNSGLSRAQIIYLAALVIGLLITSVLGSKSGAGSYHLIPYIVPVLHLYFWRRSTLSSNQADHAFAPFAIAWALTMLFLSSTHLQTVLLAYHAAPLGRRIVAEVSHDQHAFPGRTVEVGVGKDFEDPRTRYGYLTTFNGQPYTIAGAAVRDLQAGDIPIPDATLHYLASCGTQVWLIPKGDAPFSAINSYFDAPHPAFEPRVRQTFGNHYRVVNSGELFDVWACRE